MGFYFEYNVCFLMYSAIRATEESLINLMECCSEHHWNSFWYTSDSSDGEYIGWMYLISHQSQSDSYIYACSKSR